MKFFGKDKDSQGSRYWLFGLKVFEIRQLPRCRKTYLLGICIKEKASERDPEKQPSNLAMQQTILLAGVETKLLTLGLYYKDLPPDERYVLCFDHLQYHFAECIDAWTFFRYLQKRGIRAKYVVRRENALFKKLQQTNQLKDIIPVSSEMELLTDYPDIIARSRLVISSFNFELSGIFKQLPFLKFIFIEHGVTLLKEWTSHWYAGDKFDGILIPTAATGKYYEQIGFHFESCVPYHCGLSRWDLLSPATKEKEERKIFIFFTSRLSFRQGVENRFEIRDEYMKRLLSFISRLKLLIKGNDRISLHISLHHSIYEHDNHFNGEEILNGINFVPMSEISTMCREADMCITDFSSIWSDFLYRNVPVLFYCFDSDIKYPNSDDMIGWAADKIDEMLYNGCRDEETALALVKHYMARDFQLESEYLKKNDEIFWARGNNCERLWELVNK